MYHYGEEDQKTNTIYIPFFISITILSPTSKVSYWKTLSLKVE